MRSPLGSWFEQRPALRGILAGALRSGDQATVRSWNAGYPKEALENAVRCMTDLYQVLQLNGVPPARIRLVYGEAWLHGERGPDGSCLGVFTLPDYQAFDMAALDKLFKEFQILCGMGRA
jgi:hypothetical protein